MTRYNIIITLPKLAGILLLIASPVLSVITGDSVYFTSGIPSGSGLITADTIGARFGKASNNNKNTKNKNND